MAVTRGTLQIARRLRRDVGTEADTATRTLTAAWVDAWDDLAAGWQRAADDLVAEARRLEHWPRPTDIARLPRVMGVLQATEDALNRLAGRTVSVATEAALRAIDVDVELEPRIIASQAPAAERESLLVHIGGRVAVAEQDQTQVRSWVLTRIRTDAVNVIRRRTQGQITSATLPLSPDALDAVRRELISGVDLGDNPRTAAARMVAGVQGAFNGGLTRAMVISRTEILDAYRSTSATIHQANADVVPGWEWLATFDRRTCPSCLSMHGTRFPVSEPGPNDHQSGRCARLPVLASWAELGIRAPEPRSAMRSSQEWFDQLPQTAQLQIMGPARLDLYRSGRVGWGDLARLRQSPGWRPSYVPTSVRDLRRHADRGLPPTPGPARTTPAASPPPHLGTTSLPLPTPRQPRWIDHNEALQMQQRMNATAGPWTDVQRRAMEEYTGQGYQSMNNWLRLPEVRAQPSLYEDPTHPWDVVTGDLIPNTAAGMRPLPQRVTVSRRTGPGQFGFESWDPDALTALRGEVLQDPGFVSTTIKQGQFWSEPGALGAGDIELTIDVPRGYSAAYVDQVSRFPGERELLLQAGTRMRILDVTRTDSGGVHMRAVVLP